MAGEHKQPSTDEERLLRRLRVIAGGVILSLIFFLVVIDSLGRLFIDPTFRVGEIFLGSLLGALMLLIGIDVAARLPGRKNGD